jgi:SAM-dependent methyltransferase
MESEIYNLYKTLKELDIISDNNYNKWIRQYKHFFRKIELKNKIILDIGSGYGELGFYACANMATSVVCIEPELEGSTPGFQDAFWEIKKKLNYKNISLEKSVFQEYRTNMIFDIIIMQNSINHLDEEACISLNSSLLAWNNYKIILNKLYNMTSIGGTIIISDCSRYNFFGNLLKYQNPFSSTIEWHKHQSPKVWSKILKECGFKVQKVYSGAYRLNKIYLPFFLKNILNYFLASSFLIYVKK